tara:strand:+ start:390 stop:731 length:342 start_codon:yes stop_codon:yes gene_type:complete
MAFTYKGFIKDTDPLLEKGSRILSGANLNSVSKISSSSTQKYKIKQGNAVKKSDRNRFIIDEFEDGARIIDIAANPSVNIKYAAVRRVIINSMGYNNYKRILMGEVPHKGRNR